MLEHLNHPGFIPPNEPALTRSACVACMAGFGTLVLGCVCLAYAFLVPALFGPMAAIVVASERLLCSARSSSSRSAAIWFVMAFGWAVVASGMLHPPWVGSHTLVWIAALLVASKVAQKLHAGAPTDRSQASTWLVTIGAAIQLAVLHGAVLERLLGGVTNGLVSGPMTVAVRVAAVAAIELLLAGVVTLIDAACRRHGGVFRSATRPQGPVVARLNVAQLELEAGIA